MIIGSNPSSFMLEFKTKSLQLSVDTALDTSYLINGFKALIAKIKKDFHFIDILSNIKINTVFYTIIYNNCYNYSHNRFHYYNILYEILLYN